MFERLEDSFEFFTTATIIQHCTLHHDDDNMQKPPDHLRQENPHGNSVIVTGLKSGPRGKPLLSLASNARWMAHLGAVVFLPTIINESTVLVTKKYQTSTGCVLNARVVLR